MEYLFLLGSLEQHLGKGHKKSKDNYAFHCPFCNHRKPKLEVDLHTNEKGENNYACWACKTRGKTIRSLLHRLHLPDENIQEIVKYIPKGSKTDYKIVQSLTLPKEFAPLHDISHTSVSANIARSYLKKRGISEIDIQRYNIGYCFEGEYGGRIIIPSYDSNNQLNYFTARSFQENLISYKNPSVSRDIIFFENLINWNKPIILCEGPFDAIAIRRNAVALLGKTVSNALLKKILTSPLEDIYIALDKDAKKSAMEYCEQFLNMGKRTFFIDMEDKDPSLMGFEIFTKKIQQAEELTLTSLLQYKMERI